MRLDDINALAQVNRYYAWMPSELYVLVSNLKAATIGFPIGARAVFNIAEYPEVGWQWAVAMPDRDYDYVGDWLTRIVGQRTRANLHHVYGIQCGVMCVHRLSIVLCEDTRFAKMMFATECLQERFRYRSDHDCDVDEVVRLCDGFYRRRRERQD